MVKEKYKGVLVYDIETAADLGKDNNTHELRIFGCYSYDDDKYYFLEDKDEIRKIIDRHTYFVGFNNVGGLFHGDFLEGYDNRVLYYNGFNDIIHKDKNDIYRIKYKYNIDLLMIFKKRASAMKIKSGMLNDLLMRYSLDYISKTIGIVNDDSGKIADFDYSVLKKLPEEWTDEERKYIIDYTKRDLEVTKKMYEWIEDYFESFRDYVEPEDVEKKKYLTCSTAVFTYKSICKAMGWREEYSNVKDGATFGGGYVSYPSKEHATGKIYCLDFNCLEKNSLITTYTKGGFHNKKKIQNLKSGDIILSMNGEKNKVDKLSKHYYSGELLEFELENGKTFSCTENHVLPIKRDGKIINIEAKDILDTDELISSFSKPGHVNPNYNGGKTNICKVCGKEFHVFLSQEHLKTCSNACANILRSNNSAKINLGKNKNNCTHMKKMSKMRKGKKRSQEICYNIAEANRKQVQIGYNNGKYYFEGVYFKTYSEFAVAKAFSRDGIKWEYQPKVFILKNGLVYTPDFYLPILNKYVEVKESNIIKSGRNYEKFKQFFKEHKNSVIMTKNDIKNLEEVVYNGGD